MAPPEPRASHRDWMVTSLFVVFKALVLVVRVIDVRIVGGTGSVGSRLVRYTWVRLRFLRILARLIPPWGIRPNDFPRFALDDYPRGQVGSSACAAREEETS